MTLCLDSSVLVDLLRDRHPVVRAEWAANRDAGTPLVTSTLVLHELETGIHLSAVRDAQSLRLHELLRDVEIFEFSASDATSTGRLRGELRRRGRPIGEIDTLIAGQALARGWTVVTRNVRHFGRVEGLPLIDWGVSPELLTPTEIAARVAEADRDS